MGLARRRRPAWELPERAVTDEELFRRRRRFLTALGLGGAAAWGLGRGLERALGPRPERGPPLAAARSAAFVDAGRPRTPERLALSHNNYYEFTQDPSRVWELARGFRLEPWSLVVDGLVERPGAVPLETLERLGLEERVYRLRCVEAWAATIPWTGVPLAALLARVAPLPQARYVAFTSFLAPDRAPGQAEGGPYRFPYYEALRLDEAAHPLTLLATGLYGRRLAPQSGAPLRLVVPWKYGYKSAKGLVRMTLCAERPPTFWNDLFPAEYGWLSNVDPTVPHPRWSQASERLLGEGWRVPTRPFNGYGEQVARLYA